MPVNLKKITTEPELLTGGHRLCPGCAESIIARHVLHAVLDAGYFPVVANATGCLEVATTVFPHTAWKVPWIHNAFENAAATISGVEAAYRSLVRKGAFPEDRKIAFIAFGGDGGTYDIGLQSLSGALERGHKFIYVLLDNEAYMNTGIQRSSATPFAAWTTTSPVGKVIPGKIQHKKNITEIAAAHEIPYAAQTALHNPLDLMNKVQKALKFDGPAFLNVLSPCQRGWRFPSDKTIAISKMAVETRFWPVYEVYYGRKWVVNYKPRKEIPVEEYLRMQRRFAHVFKNPALIEKIQEFVDRRWEDLLRKAEATKDVEVQIPA